MTFLPSFLSQGISPPSNATSQPLKNAVNVERLRQERAALMKTNSELNSKLSEGSKSEVSLQKEVNQLETRIATLTREKVGFFLILLVCAAD